MNEIKLNENKPSFDEQCFKTYGELELYNNFDKEYTLDREPTVFKINKSFWLQKE